MEFPIGIEGLSCMSLRIYSAGIGIVALILAFVIFVVLP